PVVAFVVPEEQLAVLPAYTRRLLAEADAIAAAIPHDQLAVQWDVAVEVAVLEGIAGYSSAPFDDPQATILGQLVGLGTHIRSAASRRRSRSCRTSAWPRNAA